MRVRCVHLVIVAAVAAGACKSKEAPPSAAKVADASPPVQATTTTTDAAVKVAVIDAGDDREAAARALIERWRVAQNEGKLDAYAALYAPAFEGVRRSGKQTKTLDRAGWLKDRGAMFGSPMTVEVADLTLARDGEAIVATFTQTWSSGTYRDRGPKVMRLVKVGEEWLIGREELLSSTVLPAEVAVDGGAAAAAPAVAGEGFGLGHDADVAHLELAFVDDEQHDVLLARVAKDPGEGPLTIAKKIEHLAEVRAIWVRQEIPNPSPALAAAAGLKVVVLDGSLVPMCEGTLGGVTAVEVVGRGDHADWVWQDGPYIVRASLDAPCNGEFVRAASLPPLGIVAPADSVTAPIEKSLKKEILKSHKKALTADDVMVEVVAAPDGGLWASVSFLIDDECAPDGGGNMVLRDGHGKHIADVRAYDSLDGALDLGGDGDIDLVFGSGVVDSGTGAVERWREDLEAPTKDELMERCGGFGQE